MIKKDNPVEETNSFVDNRELHLRKVEKEIYENITQCLCLAKMQIGRIEMDRFVEGFAYIGEANLLIGKAITDLRELVRAFKEEHI